MKNTKQSLGSFRFELRGDENHIIDEIKKYVPNEREDIWSWLCYFQNEVRDNIDKKIKNKDKSIRAGLKIKKSVSTLYKEAEEEGRIVSMTNIVVAKRTELNERLRLYFKQTFPRYDSVVDEEIAEDVLDKINIYLQETGITGMKIEFPLSSGSNIHLIPITNNLQLLLTVNDEYYGDGEYTKYLDINYFIINDSAAESDVDKLIEFVKSYLH